MKEKVVFNAKNHITQLLLYILLLFPILGENIISTVFGDMISKLFSVVSCAAICFFLIHKKIHLCGFFVDLFLMILLRILITFVLKPSNIEITVSNNMIIPYGMIGYFMLFLFIDIFLEDRDRLIVIFQSMMIIMTISVFANFFFTADFQLADNIAVFREAMSTGYTNSRIWLFGHRNMIFIHHMMWILFSYITYQLENRSYSKMFYFQIFFSVLVGIVSWNATMIFTVLLVFIIELCRNGLLSKLTILHYIVVYLVLEIGIVFFRVQEFFSYIIVNFLHRNLSFTGRTGIWDYYIRQFLNESFWGKLFGNMGVTQLSVNSHNMFLGLLVFTGGIGLFLYLFLIYLAGIHLMRERRTDAGKFVAAILFGFLINSLTMEFYLQPMLALYIGYRIEKINKLIDGHMEETVN